MRLLHDNLFTDLWVAFVVYWQTMAIRVKATQRRSEAVPSRSGA